MAGEPIRNHRTIDGKQYTYWMSTATRRDAQQKAEDMRQRGFLVRIVSIHSRQFDLYVRKGTRR